MWSALGRRLGFYGPPAPENEPIASIEIVGIPSPPPEARRPIKIEPGLNDFDFPQQLLDADIPECSQRAKDTVDDLQHFHHYDPDEYLHGHIGYFHSPAEFIAFDEENLWEFHMTDHLDLPSPPMLRGKDTETIEDVRFGICTFDVRYRPRNIVPSLRPSWHAPA